MDLQLIISKIIEKSQLTGEEVLHNIQTKQHEFQDIIDQESAAKIIARELGIPIEDVEMPSYMGIADIQVQKPFEAACVVRIMNINSPKIFSTERKTGRVCNVEIADNSGRGIITLWDEDVYWMEKNKLERDDILVIRGGQMKSYNPLEITSTLLTELSIIKQADFQKSPLYRPLPQQPIGFFQPETSREGETCDFIGRVLQVGEIRDYSTGVKKSSSLNLLMTDNEGRNIGISVWDYYADFASKNLKAGQLVKLENAIVKRAKGNYELSLNWASHMIFEPIGHIMKTEEEMLKAQLPTVRILDLKAGEKGIVKAYLGKIDRAELKNGELIADAEIRDEINVKVSFQGKQALEILQLRNLPTIPIDLIVKLKEDYIKDKRLSLVVSKHKDKTGSVARHYCDQVLNFL